MSINTQLQLHVLVIGAGLGGLALAIQCALNGHKVLVLEQAKELGEIGAGIQIPPQSSRILRHWGLENAIAPVAILPDAFILRGKEGKVLSTSALNMHDHVGKMYDSPYWVVHRADLHRAMLRRAQELGVRLSLDSCVTRIDFEAPRAYLQDGTEFSADLIVGCDGLKSRTRELMLGRADPPVDTGDIAYRILVPSSEIEKVEELQFLLRGESGPSLNYWMGPGCHVVCYLLKGGETYNIVLLCPDDLPGSVKTARGNLEEMRAIFKEWDHRLELLLGLITEPPLKWKLQNHDEMSSWRHESGRFTLLGDACHPTLPYLASGAAMAVEDGAALGLLISKVKERSELKEVLILYEKLRKPRTSTVVSRSTHYRTIFHCPDGPLRDARDQRMLNENPPQEGYPNQWACPVMQKWLWGYKVEEEVDRAWIEWTVQAPNFLRYQVHSSQKL